jgi:mRNA interferase MazF
MERSLKGSVVIIHFPFSDLTGSKRRPALIVADWNDNDVILAQITSIAHKDIYAIDLIDNDFSKGSLQKESFVRPNKLFTADKTTFLTTLGILSNQKMKEITDSICNIISK